MSRFRLPTLALAAWMLVVGCASEDLQVMSITRLLEPYDRAVIPEETGIPVVDGLALARARGVVTVMPMADAPMLMVDVGQLPALAAGWEYRAWFLPAMNADIDALMTSSDGDVASLTLVPDDLGLAAGMLMEPEQVIAWNAVRGIWVTVEPEEVMLPLEDPMRVGRPAGLALVGVHPPMVAPAAGGGGGHEH